MFILAIFTKISVKIYYMYNVQGSDNVKIYVWYIQCGPLVGMFTLSSSSSKIQQVISFEVVLYIAKKQGHINLLKSTNKCTGIYECNFFTQ
jgi:hypothetical protein